MKNKVAEMVGVMMKSKEAEEFFKVEWLALYNDLVKNPVKMMQEGENNGSINVMCAWALSNWYEWSPEV